MFIIEFSLNPECTIIMHASAMSMHAWVPVYMQAIFTCVNKAQRINHESIQMAIYDSWKN